ncbi:MAG TPA: hypothetical protein VF082_09925 [Jiangellaceae bacterium]
MRRTLTAAAFVVALSLGTVGPAFADPPPPASGNGGGNSGQCTGPQDDRPASCQSQGGPGD